MSANATPMRALCARCGLPLGGSGWCDETHDSLWPCEAIGWALFGWFFEWWDDQEAAYVLKLARAGVLTEGRLRSGGAPSALARIRGPEGRAG